MPSLEEIIQQSIQSEIFSLLNVYANEKKKYQNLDQSDEPVAIMTPHPIGNYTSEFRVWRDCLLALLQAEIRMQQDGYLKQKGYQDRYTYLDHVLEKFLNTVNNFYPEKDTLKQELLDFFNTRQDFNLKQIQDDITEKLAKLALSSHTVVSGEEQNNLMTSKSSQLHTTAKQENILSWGNLDADGDPSNNVDNFVQTNLGGEKSIQGKPFVQVFVEVKTAVESSKKKGNIPQSRISCETKKGVTSVQEIAKAVLSSSGLEQEDIATIFFDSNKRKDLIDKLKIHIANLQYPQSDQAEDLVNSEADLVLRLLLSDSIILSDFDPEENKDLPLMLALIKEATADLAKEQGVEFLPAIVVLPLVESKQDIDNATKFYQDFFSKIETRISECKDLESLENLKNILSNQAEFFLGVFSGPSDATKDAGFQSITLIARLMNQAAESFKAANEKLKQKATELERNPQQYDLGEFIIEYGKGTSIKRGANLVFPDPTTFQGFNFPPFMSKALTKAILDQEDNVKIDIPFHDQFIEACCAAHQTIIGTGAKGEDQKTISSQFDAMLENKALAAEKFKVFFRKFSNNQGTRGHDRLTKWQDTRAIGAASASCFFGLPVAIGFPTNSELPFDLDRIINSSLGVQIIMQELCSIAIIDFNRAGMLGFSPEKIEQCQQYVATVAGYLGVELQFENGKYSTESIIAAVEKLSEQITPANSDLKESLECFKEQVQSISSVSANLTKLVKEQQTKQQSPDELFSAQGTLLNILSNFQLPIITANTRINERPSSTLRPNVETVKLVANQTGLAV